MLSIIGALFLGGVISLMFFVAGMTFTFIVTALAQLLTP